MSKINLYAKTYLFFLHFGQELLLAFKMFFYLGLLVFVYETAILNLDNTVWLLIHSNISSANHLTLINARQVKVCVDISTLFV